MSASSASAAWGVDTEFGVGGKATFDLGLQERAVSLAVDSAGRTVVAIESATRAGFRHKRQAATILRYLPDGTLDPRFGHKGAVTLEVPGDATPTINDLLVLPDDSVVAVGETELWVGSDGNSVVRDVLLVKLTERGRPDRSFGDAGLVVRDMSLDPAGGDPLPPDHDFARSVAVDAGGRFVVGGSTLSRWTPDGALDTTFGVRLGASEHPRSGYSIPRTDHIAVATTDAQWILSAGRVITRYEPDGDLDTTFGDNGIARFPTFFGRDLGVTDLVATAAGYVATGDVCEISDSTCNRRDVFFARVDRRGAPDLGFGAGGATALHRGPFDKAAALLALRDGRLLAAGASASVGAFGGLQYVSALFGVKADGMPDESLGSPSGVQVLRFDMNNPECGSDPAEDCVDGDGIWAGTLDPHGRPLVGGAVDFRPAQEVFRPFYPGDAFVAPLRRL